MSLGYNYSERWAGVYGDDQCGEPNWMSHFNKIMNSGYERADIGSVQLPNASCMP
jgi:hypothetical protein